MYKNTFNFDVVFEAFEGRSDILKNIDKVFADIQKTKDLKIRREHIKTLTKYLKLFTGIKTIRIRIEKDELNAAVIPSYSSWLPKFTDKFIQEDNIKTIQENADRIDSILIILGDKLFTTFSNRELTAILLHELGHVFAHNSYFPIIIKGILKLVSGVGSLVGVKFYWTDPAILSSILITCWVISRSLSFFSHIGEYNADKFSAKYGYGEEIISIMNKFKNLNIKDDSPSPNWLSKIIDFMKDVFFPGTHPLNSSRICKLAKTLQDEYKDMYPKFRQDITLALSDAKCPA